MRTLIFVFLGLCLVVSVAADTADRPVLEVGQWWETTKDRRTIVQVTDEHYMFESHDGKTMIFTRELNWVSSSGGESARPYKPNLQFPLSVGKRWSQVYLAGGTQRVREVKVKALETIKVAGRTLQAFKLEAEDQRTDRPRPAYQTYWYAPEVGAIVRSKSDEFTSWNWELVDCSLFHKPAKVAQK